MDTRDLALAIRDALECSTIATHSDDSEGDLVETGNVFIDYVDVSKPDEIIIVDEMGARYFVRLSIMGFASPTYWDNGEPREMADVRDYALPPKVQS